MNTSIVVFILSSAIGALVVFKLNHAEDEAQSAYAQQIASTYASSIEKELRHGLSSVNTLSVIVQQTHGNVKNYKQIVNYMLPMYQGIYALSLAPDGIMRQIEPEVQNELIMNHDIFEGSDREEVLSNIQEGELIFQGPFKLIQGPQGAIGMLPVFLNNKDGEKYFWGFTLVSLKFPDALADVKLDTLPNQGYAYELSGINPFTNEKEVIQSSKTPVVKEMSTNIPIKMYGADWQLIISPLNASIKNLMHLFEYILVVLVSLVMGFLSYLILTMLEQREQLKKIAMHDPLTKLPNRRLLREQLKEILEDPKNSKFEIVICYIDLDGFKDVNDKLGHHAGDQLLRVISERLISNIRDKDVVARIGGDEFVIVLNHLVSVNQAEMIINRIIRVVDQPINIFENQVKVTASLGAVIYKDGDDTECLLHAADQAMYQAKKLGKNRYFFAKDTDDGVLS